MLLMIVLLNCDMYCEHNYIFLKDALQSPFFTYINLKNTIIDILNDF